MTTKAKSDSIGKKQSNLAHKLDVPYRNLETVFLIERLVARLVADKKLSQHLVFKGGFVGLTWRSWAPSARHKIRGFKPKNITISTPLGIYTAIF